MSIMVPVLKDEACEHPVPSEWRSTLRRIADAIMGGDFHLRDIQCVEPLDDQTGDVIARVIASYGCSLAALPDESWKTSVCQWKVSYWEVLVDLFTLEEGRSDLVLHVRVFEEGTGFLYRTVLVYVP